VQRQAAFPQAENLKVRNYKRAHVSTGILLLPAKRSKQICTLLDFQAAARYRGQTAAPLSLAEGRHGWFVPGYNCRKFIAHSRRFLVVRDNEPDWLLRQLIADGEKLQSLEYDHAPGVSDQGTEIYRVTF
jgi:hypothetical protein